MSKEKGQGKIWKLLDKEREAVVVPLPNSMHIGVINEILATLLRHELR